MAKQTFTTGQVLTAAQLTNLQQTALGGGSPSVKTTSYVLVAADAGTVIQMNSTSATTVTVNTGLFSSGDSVQIQNIGAGTMTITAGTATVNSAGSLAVSQYDGGFLYFSSASSAIWFDYTQPGTTSPLTTKGDLYTRTSSGDTRLGVGANGTTLVADSAEATGLKWATPSGGGKLLQVVQASSNTETSVSGTTYGDTTLSATITPSATSSKILVFVSQQLRSRNDSATGTFSGLRLLRGSTVIFTPGTSTFTFAGITTFSTNDISFYSIANFHYLDSPSTTSATTYKTQAANSSGSGTSLAITQQSSAVSVMTLMEIGA